MNKKYELLPVEVAGKMAMFANPCSGSELFSYPVPTYPAIKGMLESILYMKTVLVVVDSIEICGPLAYTQFGFNAHATNMRKSDLKAKGNSLQRRFSPLSNVKYVIYAHAENLPREELANVCVPEVFRNTNHAHSYQDQFNRRLKRGSYQRPLCLGKKMFSPDYSGIVRLNSNGERVNRPCEDFNMVLPSMPKSWFDKPQNGKNLSPSYFHGLVVEKGILVFNNAVVNSSQAEEKEVFHA